MVLALLNQRWLTSTGEGFTSSAQVVCLLLVNQNLTRTDFFLASLNCHQLRLHSLVIVTAPRICCETPSHLHLNQDGRVEPWVLLILLQTCFAHTRADPDLNQGSADLQSAALTTELCTQMEHEVNPACEWTLSPKWVGLSPV